MKLEKGSDYIAQARIILNDSDGSRYTDALLLTGLLLGLQEAKKLRYDLFLGFTLPDDIATDTSLVGFSVLYRRALIDYVCGYAEWMDVETSDASRSAMYQASFAAKLVGASA